MRWSYRKKAATFSAAEDGVVAVEFVILFPLFLLIIVGIVEFGHLFYVRHTLTNASREGARAAVVYYTPADGRAAWAKTQAEAAVNKYLGLNEGQTKVLPGITITLPPAAVSGSAAGSTVTVTITAENVTLVLDKLISSYLTNPITVTAATTMRLE